MRPVLLLFYSAALSACSAIPELGGADPLKISPGSNPSGADASLSTGASCKTPCSLPAPDKGGDYNVTFTFTSYAPRTIPIHVSINQGHWYSAETTNINPNPVMAELQPIMPPPQTKKKF
jgi:hypothetical protein